MTHRCRDVFALLGDLLPGCTNLLLKCLLFPQFFSGSSGLLIFRLFFDLKLVAKAQLIKLKAQTPDPVSSRLVGRLSLIWLFGIQWVRPLYLYNWFSETNDCQKILQLNSA